MRRVGCIKWLERIIPFCNNLSEIPPKVFFALGNIGPEPFAERSVAVFKPFAIPQEVIHGGDGFDEAN